MKSISYQVDLLTPLFLGGAEPQKQTEIRAASIRGQLRWWFRVLGGFKSQQSTPLREQEAQIFGSAAGDSRISGKLIVRVSLLPASTDVRDDKGMSATIYDPRGYILFPLRTQKDGTSRSRAVFDPTKSPKNFEMTVLWRGSRNLEPSIRALLEVFIHLGSLGFRGRRAMGALAAKEPKLSVHEALSHFNLPSAIAVKTLPPATSSDAAIDSLATWLKSWRSHGRTIDLSKGNSTNRQPPFNPGFKWAQRDHDNAAQNRSQDTAFRPALGLPLMTKYGNWGTKPAKGSQPVGRFASPVILRPHRTAKGKFIPLVIFVDAMSWPDRQTAYRGDTPVPVSTDLYQMMKKDHQLSVLSD